MSRTLRGVVAVAAVAIFLFAVAFWIAPSSCDGGFGIYFVCGIGGLVAMFALPFALGSGNSLFVRIASGLGLVVVGVGVWVAGLVAADFQILCRMF